MRTKDTTLDYFRHITPKRSTIFNREKADAMKREEVRIDRIKSEFGCHDNFFWAAIISGWSLERSRVEFLKYKEWKKGKSARKRRCDK